VKPAAPEAPPLVGILAEVARLLEVGELDGAAQLMDAAVRSCESGGARPLGPEAVARARALLGTCMAAHVSLRGRLAGEMDRVATSRRANAAYRP
jgi:hypothetical protein